MKQEDLISVIVIAYNIEKYIFKCIKSILMQDYKKLEIIIVDDGSTDDTLQIIKKIAKDDKRIRICTKKNGGPSSARNYGLSVAQGKYIMFVDGDDFVASDYVSYLYGLIKNSNAEFAFSKNLFSSKKQKQIEKDNVQCVTPAQATALLMSTTVVVCSCNKIYSNAFLKKNQILFNDELFYGEGLSFITTVAQKARRTCIGERRVYFYRKNNGSSATTVFDIHKVKNGEKSILQIKNNLIVHSRLVNDMIMLHLSVYYLAAAVNLINYNQKAKYRNEYRKWMNYVKSNIVHLVMSSDVSTYRKCMLIGGALCPSLLARLDVVRRKRIMNNSFN